MQKPDGLIILRPEDLPHKILHLKPRDINGIGPNMEARLHQSGIHDMAALWAADSQHLRRVWNGVVGLRFHSLLHGADLPRPVNPSRSMSHQHVLAPDERTKEKVTQIIRQLLVRVAQRLHEEKFYCCRLILDIKWTQNLGHHVVESTFQETQDTHFLLQMLNPLWDSAPAFKPLRIGVTLASLKAQEAHEPDLFDRPKPADLIKAVDKLNVRFGRGTVHYGSSIPNMTSKIAFNRVPKLDEF